MSTKGQFNTKSPTIKRILKEASELSLNPSADHHATPLEDNLFEWHFTLRGPPSPSPYAGGIYHGRIILPPTYPLRPPSFRFLTPTGRFEVNREICLSISGHHEETWQPAWGIRTALVAIRSFMDSDPKGQLGGLDCSEGARKQIAKDSKRWRCAACGKTNDEILQECAEAAKTDPDKKENEVAVPQELRLAYRDDIQEKGKDTGQASQPPSIAPSTSNTTSLHSGTADAPIPAQSATPQNQLPEPTRTIPALPSPPQAPVSARTLSQPQVQIRPDPRQLGQANAPTTQDSAVPAWVDKAILGVALGLVFMLFKKLIYVY